MCFSLEWIEHFFILVVIVCAIVAIVRILLPMVFSQLGAPGGVLLQIINIFMWAVVAIFIIYIAFTLIECLAGGGFSLGLSPRR
jgi:hypothetical protein